MTIRIRLATVDDVETVFEIRTSVVENHQSREELAALGVTAEAVEAAIRVEPCIWIAESDSTPVGFAMVDHEKACVFALFVRPQFEGRGAGKILLDIAESHLFARHDRIWLETGGGSRAARFYLLRGWREALVLPEGDIRFEKTRPVN